MPVTGASIGNHIAENRESVQRDRPLPSSVGASSIIKIESEPILDADPPAQGVNIAGRMTSKADLRPRRRYVRFTLNELTSSARRETIRKMDTVAIGRYRFLRRVMN